MKNLITALIQFQNSVKAIPKNKINPFYNSRYAELSTVIDVCQPALNDAGLVVIQRIDVAENCDNILVTMLCHNSGEMVESKIYLPKIQDSQKLTGAITYLRRSTYLAILGLVAEDDLDGNDVVESPNKTAYKPTQPVGPSIPASEAQKSLLTKLGIYYSQDITKSEASKLIESANKKKGQ